MKTDADSAKVGFPPPFIYLGLLLIGLAADRAIGWSLGLPLPARVTTAVILIVPGAGLLLAASGRFRGAGTNVKPWMPTTTVVSAGIYGHSRNPMYIAMALIHAGLAVGFGSPGALVTLPVAILLIRTQVIAREERYLEEKFGDDYRAYKARVRRWL